MKVKSMFVAILFIVTLLSLGQVDAGSQEKCAWNQWKPALSPDSSRLAYFSHDCQSVEIVGFTTEVHASVRIFDPYIDEIAWLAENMIFAASHEANDGNVQMHVFLITIGEGSPVAEQILSGYVWDYQLNESGTLLAVSHSTDLKSQDYQVSVYDVASGFPLLAARSIEGYNYHSIFWSDLETLAFIEAAGQEFVVTEWNMLTNQINHVQVDELAGFQPSSVFFIEGDLIAFDPEETAVIDFTGTESPVIKTTFSFQEKCQDWLQSARIWNNQLIWSCSAPATSLDSITYLGLFDLETGELLAEAVVDTRRPEYQGAGILLRDLFSPIAQEYYRLLTWEELFQVE